MQMTGQRDGNEVWMVLRFEPDSGGGGGEVVVVVTVLRYGDRCQGVKLDKRPFETFMVSAPTAGIK